jgi:hypothetical protein
MALSSLVKPLRFATPGQLVICLIMFFLPWIEIQCPMPDMKAAMDPSKKGPPDLKSMPYVSFVTQSGWQAATGDYTFADPMIQKQMDSAKSMAADLEKMGDKSGKSAKVEKKKDGPDGAPLLWVHLLGVIAGIGVGFAMPLGKARKFALIGCCAVALLTTGGQAAMGFPITKKMKEDGAKEGMGGMGGMGDMGPGAGKGASAPKLNPDDVFKTVYKFPFFLSIFLTIGALATAAITPNQGGGMSKKPLYDMDEDDDEDDRPRKRRRDQDDEDEDDEPRARRKRRDDDDEDQDERPAKKKRRDDDEEEEEPKPRRKAARDEEEEPKPRRKPARDEDEEEEEPKPRREEKPSKGGFGEKGKGGKPPGKSPPAGDGGGGGGNPFNFG